MSRLIAGTVVMLCLVNIVPGCAEPTSTAAKPDAAAASAAFLVNEEPADALGVGDARESVEDGQEVSLVGVIGGSRAPFVEGAAAFTIVDPKVPYCADEEGCPTPWDYCCTQNQVKENIASVKFVDESGSLVESSAKDLLGVKELSTVVVSGIASRDEQGNLSLAANKVFVRNP